MKIESKQRLEFNKLVTFYIRKYLYIYLKNE